MLFVSHRRVDSQKCKQSTKINLIQGLRIVKPSLKLDEVCAPSHLLEEKMRVLDLTVTYLNLTKDGQTLALNSFRSRVDDSRLARIAFFPSCETFLTP